jgi:hypothetical protein
MNYYIIKDTTINNKKVLSYFDGTFFTFDDKKALIYSELKETVSVIDKLRLKYPNDNVRGDLVR